MQIKFDCMYRKFVLSFGIDFGANVLVRNKPQNFFIELSLFFWTFGLELTFKDRARQYFIEYWKLLGRVKNQSEQEAAAK